MKTALLGLMAILLLAMLSLFVLPGCNKSGVLPAVNKTTASKSTSLDGKADTVAKSPVKKDTVAKPPVKKDTVAKPPVKKDTVARPPVQYVIVPLTGDQITLIPHFYKSPTADSSYIYIVAQPKNGYCYTSVLQFSQSLDNSGNYSIRFLDVVEPLPCVGGNTPLFADINFPQTPGGKLPNGTFPLTVTLNGTTYTGSIVVTATAITFNWSYTSGVLIAPQQISR